MEEQRSSAAMVLAIGVGMSGSEVLPTGEGALLLIDVTGGDFGETVLELSTVILADAAQPPNSYSVTAVDLPFAVPEPSMASLLAAGLVGVGLMRKRLGRQVQMAGSGSPPRLRLRPG